MSNFDRTVVHRTIIAILSFFVVLVLSVSANAGDIDKQLKAPEAGKIQIIRLNDGSSLVGKVVEVGADSVKFETKTGVMTLPKSNIVEIKEIETSSMKKGAYWFPNPNRTRLYMAPTGRMLESGEGYFTDMYLFFPGVAFGITDFFTIGGGISLFPGVSMENQIIYFTPKLGFKPQENLSLAVSALYIQLPDFDIDDSENNISVGVLFATGTVGPVDKCFTFGLGYGFAEDKLADKPAVLIGGEYRFARRLSFVSENWVFPGLDEPLVSYGLRFFGEDISVDLALFTVLGEDAFFPGIPYVDFVWRF